MTTPHLLRCYSPDVSLGEDISLGYVGVKSSKRKHCCPRSPKRSEEPIRHSTVAATTLCLGIPLVPGSRARERDQIGSALTFPNWPERIAYEQQNCPIFSAV